ncbi:flippase [Enterococcus sp. AZ154]|uniref:flippase n=1 Tax=unclassified Enterococcus TaxID=2608891 RepID=UPI003D2AEDAF
MKVKSNKLVENFFSLASVQIMNYILPLITLPFLTRTLGVETYGLISFSQAIIQYFILITEFGFNLTGARDVSQSRGNRIKQSEILWSIMILKSILLIACFGILMVLVNILPKLQGYTNLYLYTFGMVLGNVLFPSFYFQGIEEMKFTAILNFVSKLVFTIGIFILVKTPNDYLLVPILNTLGSILSGILSLTIIIISKKATIIIPKRQLLVKQLKEAFPLFLSNVFTSFYTTSSVVILGFFAGNVSVGYYSAADKIIKAVTNITSPLVQAVYPNVSLLLKQNKNNAVLFVRKITKYSTIIVGMICFLLCVASPFAFPYFFGNSYNRSISLIMIMSFIPLIILWAKIFGTLVLVNMGWQNKLSKVYFLTGILSLISTFILVPLFNEIGTAVNTVFIESVASLLIIRCVYKDEETRYFLGGSVGK